MKYSEIRKWERDNSYYDASNREINTIFSLTNFKDKRVLDVGSGIGRLTLPLSNYAKEIVALDLDKSLINYCLKRKKRRNIKYIFSDISNFHDKEFDIALWAQPIYENLNKILRSISSNLKDNGKLIVVKWIDDDNDYNEILTPFWEKDKTLMDKVEEFSSNFEIILRRYFRLKKINKISTYCIYPNKDELKNSIIQDSPKPFTLEDRKILSKLLMKYDYRKIKVSMKIYLCEKK